MKKKKILYSELAPAPRKSAPVELARALAAARLAEEQRPAPVVSSPNTSTPLAAPAAAPRPIAPAAALRPVALATPPTPLLPRSLRDRVRGRSGQVDILLFRVGEERFGIDLAAVEEAIDIPPVHHVPEMPPAMLGVITVRGTLTSVYSPAEALGLSLHDGTSALIFRRGRSRLAVVVDEVDDVTALDLSSLRDAPGLDAGDGIVLGVVRQRDVLLALVDADALLAACQAAPLLETV